MTAWEPAWDENVVRPAAIRINFHVADRLEGAQQQSG